MNRAYRVTLICGALPLLVGLAIFLLWLSTRCAWLEMAGLFTLEGGLILLVIGAVALVRFRWLANRAPELPRGRISWATFGGAGLLLSNFLVAGGIIAVVLPIETDSQTQNIYHMAKTQRLTFHARDGDAPISGVTLHVHGHIEGKALITGPLGEPRQHPITGDVD